MPSGQMEFGRRRPLGKFQEMKTKRKNVLHEYPCRTEGSKSDREREILYNISYTQNLKRNDTNELIYKTETDSKT